MKRFLLILCVALLAVACATASAPATSGDSRATSSNSRSADQADQVAASGTMTSPQSGNGVGAAQGAGQQSTSARRALGEDERRALNKALLRAAEAGETAKVSALLSRGADANAGNSIRVPSSPLSVLMLAVVRAHVETARELIKQGANVNTAVDFPEGGTTVPQKGVTALMQAAAGGDLPMVKLLVEHGADVNARDGDGATALMGTTDGNVVAYLLEHKADPNVRDKLGNTALIILAKHSRFGDASAVVAAEALLAKGADVNAANAGGETPLVVAEQGGKDELVALFRKAGAKK